MFVETVVMENTSIHDLNLTKFDVVVALKNKNVRISGSDFGVDLSPLNDIYFNDAPDCAVIAETGVKVKLPPYVMAEIRPRSSLHKYGLWIPNSPATIDPSYRGDCKLILCCFNTSLLYNKFGKAYVPSGTRLAQMTFQLSLTPANYEIPDTIRMLFMFNEELYDKFDIIFPTTRGSKGIGSTGV